VSVAVGNKCNLLFEIFLGILNRIWWKKGRLSWVVVRRSIQMRINWYYNLFIWRILLSTDQHYLYCHILDLSPLSSTFLRLYENVSHHGFIFVTNANRLVQHKQRNVHISTNSLKGELFPKKELNCMEYLAILWTTSELAVVIEQKVHLFFFLFFFIRVAPGWIQEAGLPTTKLYLLHHPYS